MTPSLSGYAFTPALRSYANVTANQTAQNFTATPTYQVSGTVRSNGSALAGVAFAATGGMSCTSSNAAGQYSCTVLQGWTGTVTPSLNGYVFAPISRSYTYVTGNETAQDFTAAANVASTRIFYVHVDHLDTPRLVSDSQQRIVWRWDQQELFGVNVPDQNPSGAGGFELSLRFPGQYFDKETNLNYNYFRDYDSLIGRYVQSDLIGLTGGLNTYTYVRGDPLIYRDPLGLQIAPAGPGSGGLTGGLGGLGGFGGLSGRGAQRGSAGRSNSTNSRELDEALGLGRPSTANSSASDDGDKIIVFPAPVRPETAGPAAPVPAPGDVPQICRLVPTASYEDFCEFACPAGFRILVPKSKCPLGPHGECPGTFGYTPKPR